MGSWLMEMKRWSEGLSVCLPSFLLLLELHLKSVVLCVTAMAQWKSDSSAWTAHVFPNGTLPAPLSFQLQQDIEDEKTAAAASAAAPDAAPGESKDEAAEEEDEDEEDVMSVKVDLNDVPSSASAKPEKSAPSHAPQPAPTATASGEDVLDI